MHDMTLLCRFSNDGDQRVSGLSKPHRLTDAYAGRASRSSLPFIRLALPFPLAGARALIWFDATAVETIKAELGADYLSLIDDGLATHEPAIIRTCLSASLRGADITVDDVIELLPLGEVSAVIVDALSLRLYGKRASSKNAEDIFVERAHAFKAILDAAGTEGHEIVLNEDGSATIPAAIVAPVALLVASLDDLEA